jgi:hypothetical protein
MVPKSQRTRPASFPPRWRCGCALCPGVALGRTGRLDARPVGARSRPGRWELDRGHAFECRATGVIEKLGPLLTLRFADDDEDDYKDEED